MRDFLKVRAQLALLARRLYLAEVARDDLGFAGAPLVELVHEVEQALVAVVEDPSIVDTLAPLGTDPFVDCRRPFESPLVGPFDEELVVGREQRDRVDSRLVGDSRLDSPLGSEEAALDVGANNLVACTVSTGQKLLYEGRNLFEEFRATTERIAYYQSLLEDQRESSKRIDRLYRKRTNQRNHAQDSLVRGLVERLYDEGVSTLYVGDLKGVLDTHWSPRVNEKTHKFWAYRRFINRLEDVCEEYSIMVEEASEAWTSQTCPECGERENTIRHENSLTCPCGFEEHADLVASESLLRRQNTAVGAMARPVYLKWNKHSWREHHSPPSIAV